MAAKLGLQGRDFGVVTLHRPSNVDDQSQLSLIVEQLVAVAPRAPLVFPVHPRTRQRLRDFGLAAKLEAAASGAVRLTEPLSYIEFMSLVSDCRFALTDSGGVQEETSYLGIPCESQAQSRAVTRRRGGLRGAPKSARPRAERAAFCYIAGSLGSSQPRRRLADLASRGK